MREKNILLCNYRYMIQRQEKCTPYRPHPAPHLTGTKRSLYRDLEKQFLASRRISDTDAGGTVAQENKDPVSCDTRSKQCDLSLLAENGMTEPVGVKTGQVSVIRKAPSSVQISDNVQPPKRSGFLTEITDNQLAAGPCTSPEKLPRKQAEQEARYVSALALIQLAQGHS